MLPDIFNPASPEARAIATLFYIVLVICAVIFAIVVGFLAHNIIRFRKHRPDESLHQQFGNRKLEIIWTVIPLITVAVIFVFTVRASMLSDPDVNRKPDLRVTGHQWWWEVQYLKAGVTTANEIHIPIHKQLLVELESDDVIHSFWEPRLDRKVDMIPGQKRYVWIESDDLGDFLGSCAEYCGNQHAWMRFRVIAQTQKKYDAWLANQEKDGVKPTGDDLAIVRGQKDFDKMSCSSCHAIKGTGFNANAAPDLTHIGSRETLGGGVLTNTPANLARWLHNPQAVKPGCYMPNVKLSDQQTNDLVAYLESLK